MASSSKGRTAALKLRVEVNGEACMLDLPGSADVQQIAPGVYSLLIDCQSVTVRILPHAEGQEVWVGRHRYIVALADPRDRAAASSKQSARGPVELRAQMPGKIIKLLVQPGDEIKAGQGMLIVEAMKMQNEVKSPKDGAVGKIQVTEGSTVSAGDLLMVVL